MGKSLVIVESPAKARTIAGYLGNDYAVESSIGHVRDLPNRASDVPEAQRKRFGALGVDVSKDFEPYYVVDPKKKKVVTELKKQLAGADELLLATDEDREGEAIAWHLVELLKPKIPVRRMVFHEITKDAITRALHETRSIDARLVDAQETRRILDRLYGYEVSPVLWKKVTRGLSAGRVQSVATRLVVERERERMAFTSAVYWDLLATFDPGAFQARLVSVAGARVAQGTRLRLDSDPLAATSLVRLDEDAARSLAAGLEGASFRVGSVDEKPYRRKPAAPFRTATLQQEASRKLRFSAQTTMRVAQRLYESGYITYMRTDSTTLSETALDAARAQATTALRRRPRPREAPPLRAGGGERARGARGHPARGRHLPHAPGSPERARPRRARALRPRLEANALASQMEDARGQTVCCELAATSSSGERRRVRGVGHGHHVPRIPGSRTSRAETIPRRTTKQRAPAASRGRAGGLTARSSSPTGTRRSRLSATPSPRLVERSRIVASAVRRPTRRSSATILDRGYVFKKGTALVPTFVAFAWSTSSSDHFEQLVDFDFTARMEDDLDRIAAGDGTAWTG